MRADMRLADDEDPHILFLADMCADTVRAREFVSSDDTLGPKRTVAAAGYGVKTNRP